MNKNNIDVSVLMNMLSKMDKNQLENGISELNKILKPGSSQQQILNNLKNNMNNK